MLSCFLCMGFKIFRVLKLYKCLGNQEILYCLRHTCFLLCFEPYCKPCQTSLVLLIYMQIQWEMSSQWVILFNIYLHIIGRPWCWQRLKAEEEGDRESDGWVASPIQWTWTWANSGRWWEIGKPDVFQSTGSWRAGRELATEQHTYWTIVKVFWLCEWYLKDIKHIWIFLNKGR